jgi:choline transport protein
MLRLFVFYIALFYTITDFTALYETTFPSVVGAIYLQATNNHTVSMVLLLIVFIPSLIGCITYMAASLRLIHGFTRGGAVPNTPWWAKVEGANAVPINVLYVSILVNFLMSFVYLASSSGFNIMIGSIAIFYNLGYLPCFIPSLLNNRRYIGSGYFQMSWAPGMFCAAFATIFNLCVMLVFCLPSISPITPANLNWSFLFGIVGMALVAIGWFCYGKTHYLSHITERDVIQTQIIVGSKLHRGDSLD